MAAKLKVLALAPFEEDAQPQLCAEGLNNVFAISLGSHGFRRVMLEELYGPNFTFIL